MISSDAGVWGETAIGAYSVSKRAVNMLVQTLAVEAGPHGIRVNAICPGDTAPGMATHVGGRDESGDSASWTLPPLARVGTGAISRRSTSGVSRDAAVPLSTSSPSTMMALASRVIAIVSSRARASGAAAADSKAPDKATAVPPAEARSR